MGLALRLVDTSEGFYELRGLWSELLDRCQSKNVFLTWEWMYTWWEIYGKGKRLLILIAEQDGEVVGIAPLCIASQPLSRFLTSRQLRFLGAEAVCPDLVDFIIAEREEEVRSAFLENIVGRFRTEWDVGLLEDISGSSPTVEMILHKLSGQLLPCRVEPGRSCPYLPLPRSWDEMLMSLSSQFRKNIRKARKRLDAGGRVSFSRIVDESAVEPALQQLIELHQKRWREKGLPGAFAAPQFVEFHCRISRRFFERGWLYLTLLKLDGRVIAARYGFIYHGVNYAYQGGFDPEWAEHQVGLVIQSYCIEDEIRQQLVEHNFLRGSNSAKLRWTSLTRNSVTVRFGKSDLRHAIAEADLVLDRRIKPLMREVLPRWGVAGLRRMKGLL